MHEVTQVLEAIHRDDSGAAEELLPSVYQELRRLAAHKMAKLPSGQTLQATALVHEAYLRLLGSGPARWDNRGHFFAAAAEAMRRILIDQARRKSRRKRGDSPTRVNLDEVHIAITATPDNLIAVNEALDGFAQVDPAKAHLVKLRFFVGMTLPEAAEALGMSLATAKRHWTFAKAWLADRLKAE